MRKLCEGIYSKEAFGVLQNGCLTLIKLFTNNLGEKLENIFIGNSIY